MKRSVSAWIERVGKSLLNRVLGRVEKRRRLKERFEEIYAKNEWRHGSGEGSRPENTRGYVAFLEEFLMARDIRSVVDMGCGDWQFSKDIRWGAARYLGLDVVGPVIRKNRRKYAKDGVSFRLYSGNPMDLPTADLLIVKDVLQHLSDQNVMEFLPYLRRFKYALITNCVNPKGPTENRDTQDGGFRYLDLRLPPFRVEASEVFTFTHPIDREKNPAGQAWWLKRVLLVEGAGK
jgi:SAM-dependent methyltransferase